eukprot:1767286-Pyramimonas_sp.AAC.1
MHSRGGPGAQDPLSLALGNKSGGVGRVNPAGVKDGYKPGAAGAPNSKEAFRLVNYLGMRAETKQQKATMVRLAGAERLDLYHAVTTLILSVCAGASQTRYRVSRNDALHVERNFLASCPRRCVCRAKSGHTWGAAGSVRQGLYQT